MKAEAFFVLWMGHLVGDYVLQNGYIARGKEKKLGVLLIHILLIAASQLFFFIPDLNRGVLNAVGFVVISHFFIDFSKFRLSKFRWVSTTWYYLLDQGFHLLTLFIASFLIKQQNSLFSGPLSLLVCAALVNAYVWGIFAHIGWGNRDNGYKRDWEGYVFRGASAIVHNLHWIGGFAVLLSGWFIEKSIRKNTQESIISFAMSFISNILLINIIGRNLWR